MRFTNLCLIYQPGKARRKGLLTYTITPERLLLCHNGKVKFSLHTGKICQILIHYTQRVIYIKPSDSVGVGVNTIIIKSLPVICQIHKSSVSEAV